MDFLVQKEGLKAKIKDGIVDEKDHAAALRATQRCLLRRGFARGVRTGKVDLSMKHLAMKNHFVRRIF